MKKIFRKLMMITFIFVSLLISKDIILDLLNPIIDDYESEYICVMNRDAQTIEYEKDLNDRAYPASLTKIMTTILALEHIEDLSAVAPVDIDSYREMIANNSSMAGFYGKEQVTYRDLLYGTMLPSGGEAANSLAIHVGGNVDNFVRMMNEKAVELELENTHFISPEGFHYGEQYTTAYDMAILLDYALENDHFRTIFTTDTFETTETLDHPNGITLESTVLSKLNETNQDGFTIIGGKSGTTYEAGQCWATLGIKDGHEYIVVAMGAPLNNISNPDMKQRDDTIKLYSRIK